MNRFTKVVLLLALATLCTTTTFGQTSHPAQFPPGSAPSKASPSGPFIPGRSYSASSALGPFYEMPWVFQPNDPLSVQCAIGSTSQSGVGPNTPTPPPASNACPFVPAAALFVNWSTGLISGHGEAAAPISFTNGGAGFTAPNGVNNISGGTGFGLAVTASKNDCSAPAFASCNFIYATPLATPTNGALTASTSGGSLATSTYYFKVTLVSLSGGEGVPSAETNVAVTGPTGSVSIAVPTGSDSANPPAAGWNVYASNTTGTEQFVAFVSGFATAYTFTALPSSSAAGFPTAAAGKAYKVLQTASALTASAGIDNQLLALVTTNATTVTSVQYPYQYSGQLGPVVVEGGTTITATNAQSALTKVIFGSAPMTGGTATVTFPTLFTSTASFFCVAVDQTTTATAVKAVPASATTLSLAAGAGTDVVAYICVGN